VDVVDAKIITLVDDMLETMHASEGVGLAAVQVGVLRRVFVIDISDAGDEPIVAINPEVTHSEGQQQEQEACLSIPKLAGTVTRPARVTLKATNRHGEEYVRDCEGFLAVAVCHEMDHLNGILYTEIATEIFEEDEDDRATRKAAKRERRAKARAAKHG